MTRFVATETVLLQKNSYRSKNLLLRQKSKVLIFNFSIENVIFQIFECSKYWWPCVCVLWSNKLFWSSAVERSQWFLMISYAPWPHGFLTLLRSYWYHDNSSTKFSNYVNYIPVSNPQECHQLEKACSGLNLSFQASWSQLSNLICNV